ncbi:hypothetical protein NDU88_003272 [Pleurodeles waltl]|uniref:Uncharacterized protein n=1 Tax=Pleurodeles waltl TaxID=8319 RepID=A0AAV7WUV7_PLEWA|nr:hypothetical protein NDU88_003272 [Pleurodeles waltl]
MAKTKTLDERKRRKMEKNGRRRVEGQEAQEFFKTKPDLNTRAWEQQRGEENAEKPAMSSEGRGYFRFAAACEINSRS